MQSVQSILSVAVGDRHCFVRQKYDWSQQITSNYYLLWYHLPANKHAQQKTSVVVPDLSSEFHTYFDSEKRT